MYEAFYHLSLDPFRLSPDHRFCYRHPSYKKAQAYLRYALERAEGFVMVTGQPGTGKTTLINDLLARLDPGAVTVARLATTQLRGEDFLRSVAYAFGLPAERLDQATVLREIERLLVRLRETRRRALLIVDEAQDLQPSALTELRLLANMQLGNELLMQAFLIGQERLSSLVRAPEMVQFRQRILAAAHLEPLTAAQTRAYIEHRLERVGWVGDPSFEAPVFELLHPFTQGIPRQINLVCSRLLLHGCVEEVHALTAADAITVLEELRAERLHPVEGTLLDADPPGAAGVRSAPTLAPGAPAPLGDGGENEPIRSLPEDAVRAPLEPDAPAAEPIRVPVLRTLASAASRRPLRADERAAAPASHAERAGPSREAPEAEVPAVSAGPVRGWRLRRSLLLAGVATLVLVLAFSYAQGEGRLGRWAKDAASWLGRPAQILFEHVRPPSPGRTEPPSSPPAVQAPGGPASAHLTAAA